MKKKNLKEKNTGLKVLPGKGRRFSFRNFMQALIFYVLLLLALVVVVQVSYHWLGDQFLAWRLQVVKAEPGVMQQKTSTMGTVTRGEEVITAPANGMVLNLVPAGERISAGNAVITIAVLSKSDMEALRGSEEQEPDVELLEQVIDYWQELFPVGQEQEETAVPETAVPETAVPETVDQEREDDRQEEDQIDLPDDMIFEELIVIRNERAGFISHYFDSWENYEGPLYISGDDSAEHNFEGYYIVEGDLVEAGEPIVKIVDNWSWYFSVVLALHPGRLIASQENIDIEFNFAPQQSVSARRCCYEIDEDKQEVRITYIIEKQLTGFDQVRRAEASLLYRRQQGIIVPSEAVFEKDKGYGVYLNQGGRVIYKPVTIIERQEENVMVEGIAPYSLVISRPDLVEEGQRLN